MLMMQLLYRFFHFPIIWNTYIIHWRKLCLILFVKHLQHTTNHSQYETNKNHKWKLNTLFLYSGEKIPLTRKSLANTK